MDTKFQPNKKVIFKENDIDEEENDSNDDEF